MTENEAIHICRNPWGFSEVAIRKARLLLCDAVESWKDAYENMRDFAEQSGLDVTCYSGSQSAGDKSA